MIIMLLSPAGAWVWAELGKRWLKGLSCLLFGEKLSKYVLITILDNPVSRESMHTSCEWEIVRLII